VSTMKTKEVLKLTELSRSHLSRLVKSGVFRVLKKPNGQYDYNVDDVYKYLGLPRCHLNIDLREGFNTQTKSRFSSSN